MTIPHEESCVRNDTRKQLATGRVPETGPGKPCLGIVFIIPRLEGKLGIEENE